MGFGGALANCYYTLVLRYDTNRFYLAPISSISIEEDRDLETIDDAGCATCGAISDRTWKIKANFVSCDLASAWALFNRLQAFINAGCENGDLTIERTVCRETPLVYEVKKVRMRMTDSHLQRIARPRVLAMFIEFDLKVWVEEGEGAVLVGA